MSLKLGKAERGMSWHQGFHRVTDLLDLHPVKHCEHLAWPVWSNWNQLYLMRENRSFDIKLTFHFWRGHFQHLSVKWQNTGTGIIMVRLFFWNKFLLCYFQCSALPWPHLWYCCYILFLWLIYKIPYLQTLAHNMTWKTGSTVSITSWRSKMLISDYWINQIPSNFFTTLSKVKVHSLFTSYRCQIEQFKFLGSISWEAVRHISPHTATSRLRLMCENLQISAALVAVLIDIKEKNSLALYISCVPWLCDIKGILRNCNISIFWRFGRP